MPRRVRKQRVVLRTKQREQQKLLIWRVAMRVAVLILTIGAVAGMVTRGDLWARRFVQRHTPSVQIQASGLVSGLLLAQELPSRSYYLWMPGVERGVRKRIVRKFPEIRAVHIEKYFLDNRVVLRVEPRVPLVRWEDCGMDREGVVFSVDPARWAPLPTAAFPPSEASTVLGHWTAELAQVSELWSRVVRVGKDLRGDMSLDLRTGAHVVWGPPDTSTAQRKARSLCWVLDDAHQRLGGAAVADLRFFDDGRVVVKPKSALGRQAEGGILWQNKTS